METRAHHVLIGLFTLGTAVAALLFALWMSYAAGERSYQPYRILFERSVSGLSVGSRVQYNGIEVGDVTELNLNPDDPRQVITMTHRSRRTRGQNLPLPASPAACLCNSTAAPLKPRC